MVELRVVCTPVSKGNKMQSGMEKFHRRIRGWERATRDAYWLWQSNQRMRGLPARNSPMDGWIRVDATYYHERPKNHFDRHGALLSTAPRLKNSAPDGDKLERAAFDALTKAGVIHDDARVCCGYREKVYCNDGEPPGALIRVYCVHNVTAQPFD